MRGLPSDAPRCCERACSVGACPSNHWILENSSQQTEDLAMTQPQRNSLELFLMLNHLVDACDTPCVTPEDAPNLTGKGAIKADKRG